MLSESEQRSLSNFRQSLIRVLFVTSQNLKQCAIMLRDVSLFRFETLNAVSEQ